MLPPPFRPNVPPPQAVLQRPHEQPPPQPVEYFDKPRQFVPNAPPPNAYQQCVNQPPPFAGRPPGQPPPPGVLPSQPMRNTYMELEPKPEVISKFSRLVCVNTLKLSCHVLGEREVSSLVRERLHVAARHYFVVND